MWIRIRASDGFELSAWREDPSSSPRGAVVVLQEIFGVNSHIRSICSRLASGGYRAIAPALFDRQQPSFESGYSPSEVEEARRFIAGLNLQSSMLDIAAARDAVKGVGKVGVVGFCLGGSLAYATAVEGDGFAAAVGFYGGMIAKMADQAPKVPVQLHFGKEDRSIPMDDVSSITRMRPECQIHVYDAGHGFNCDARAAYHRQSAELAWSRTLDFLSSHVAVS